MKKIIFACIHNAGRSQIAAAYFNQMADPNKAMAISAGTEPAERVHPTVQAVMLEEGIDLSGARPKKLTEALCQGVILLVTLGCGEKCPYLPGLQIEDWPLPDPKNQDLASVRVIRNEVRGRVHELVERLKV